MSWELSHLADPDLGHGLWQPSLLLITPEATVLLHIFHKLPYPRIFG